MHIVRRPRSSTVGNRALPVASAQPVSGTNYHDTSRIFWRSSQDSKTYLYELFLSRHSMVGGVAQWLVRRSLAGGLSLTYA